MSSPVRYQDARRRQSRTALVHAPTRRSKLQTDFPMKGISADIRRTFLKFLQSKVTPLLDNSRFWSLSVVPGNQRPVLLLPLPADESENAVQDGNIQFPVRSPYKRHNVAGLYPPLRSGNDLYQKCPSATPASAIITPSSRINARTFLVRHYFRQDADSFACQNSL